MGLARPLTPKSGVIAIVFLGRDNGFFGTLRWMSTFGHGTNPLSREGLAAQSGNYVCRSNYLNERR